VDFIALITPSSKLTSSLRYLIVHYVMFRELCFCVFEVASDTRASIVVFWLFNHMEGFGQLVLSRYAFFTFALNSGFFFPSFCGFAAQTKR
jgi:hypothetical protein